MQHGVRQIGVPQIRVRELRKFKASARYVLVAEVPPGQIDVAQADPAQVLVLVVTCRIKLLAQETFRGAEIRSRHHGSGQFGAVQVRLPQCRSRKIRIAEIRL